MVSLQKYGSYREAHRSAQFWLSAAALSLCGAVLLEILTLTSYPSHAAHFPSAPRILVFFLACLYVNFRLLRRLLTSNDDKSSTTSPRAKALQTLKGLLFAALSGVLGYLLYLLAFSRHFDATDYRPAVVAAIGGVVVFILIYCRKTLFSKPEWLFLVICVAASSSIVVCLPPMTGVSADDHTHWSGTVPLSYIFDGEYTQADKLLDSAQGAYWLDGTPDIAPVFSWSGQKELSETVDSLDSSGTVLELSGLQDSTGASYLTVRTLGRIPNAVGLWVGRVLHLSFTGRVASGRLAGALFYALIIFLAIRSLRSGKLILALVALYPPLVFLSASYSYDPWLIALISLGYARFIGRLQSPEGIRAGDLAPILIPLTLGILVKGVYFFLLFPLLLAPKGTYESRRTKRLMLVAVLIAVMVLILTFTIPIIFSGSQSATDSRGTSAASSPDQISFILSDPLGYIKILAHFFETFFSPATYLSLSFMNMVVYKSYPHGIPILWAGLLLAAALLDRNEEDGRYRSVPLALGYFVAAAASIALSATALYISWTAVRAPIIDGMQPRYIFPLYFPTLALCLNVSIVNRMNARRFTAVMLGSAAIILAFTLFEMVFVFLP